MISGSLAIPVDSTLHTDLGPVLPDARRTVRRTQPAAGNIPFAGAVHLALPRGTGKTRTVSVDTALHAETAVVAEEHATVTQGVRALMQLAVAFLLRRAIPTVATLDTCTISQRIRCRPLAGRTRVLEKNADLDTAAAVAACAHYRTGGRTDGRRPAFPAPTLRDASADRQAIGGIAPVSGGAFIIETAACAIGAAFDALTGRVIAALSRTLPVKCTRRTAVR